MTKRLPPGVRAYFSSLGKKGGALGGKRSLETMTAAERRARARKAGLVGAAVRRAKAKANEDAD
jgi:hypothetical protein